MKTVEKKLSAQNIYAKDEDVIQELVDKLVEKKIDRMSASFEKRIEVLMCTLFKKENESLRTYIKLINFKKKWNKMTQPRLIVTLFTKQTKREKKSTIKSNTHEPITYAYMVYLIGMLSKRLHILIRLSWRKKSELQTDIDESDIDSGHRLGKFNPNKPRPVIIRFTSRLLKDDVMSRRNPQDNENTSLTKTFHSWIKRYQDEVKSVWTRNGRIMIRRFDDSISPGDFEYFNQWLALRWSNRNGQR